MNNSKIPSFIKDIRDLIFDFEYEKININKDCILYEKEYTNELGDTCINLKVYYKKDRSFIDVGDIVYKSESDLTEEETYIYDSKCIYFCDKEENVCSVYDIESKSMYYTESFKLSK